MSTTGVKSTAPLPAAAAAYATLDRACTACWTNSLLVEKHTQSSVISVWRGSLTLPATPATRPRLPCMWACHACGHPRLGDIVLEEIIVRLIARQALAALEWEEEEEEERRKEAKENADRGEDGSGKGLGSAAPAGAGAGRRAEGGRRETATRGGFGVPAALRPLSWRLDFATRLAVSNANLRAVSCWPWFSHAVPLPVPGTGICPPKPVNFYQ